jgi:hypothetical protein
MSYMFGNTGCAFDSDRAEERYKLLKDWNLSNEFEERNDIFSVEYVEPTY